MQRKVENENREIQILCEIKVRKVEISSTSPHQNNEYAPQTTSHTHTHLHLLKHRCEWIYRVIIRAIINLPVSNLNYDRN